MNKPDKKPKSVPKSAAWGEYEWVQGRLDAKGRRQGEWTAWCHPDGP